MSLMKCSLCKVIFIILIIFLFSSYEGYCNDDFFHISNSSDMDVLINEGNVAKSVVNDNISKVHINTDNLSKGYYTSSLSKKISGDFSSYCGISLYINTNDALKINLNLQSILGSNYKINESSKILICYSDGNYYEIISESYTLFEIPAKFSGRIFIPFTSMYDENGNNVTNDLNSLDIIRVIIGLEENNNKDFEIGDFAFFSSDSPIYNELINETYILGDNQNLIPVEGQNISSYRLFSNDGYIEQGDFYLKSNIDGVYITKDGKLTISNNAKEQQVQIISSFGDSKYIKDINLKNNITAISSTKDVNCITSSSLLLNKYFINFIRIILLVLFILFVFVYKKWRKILQSK